MMVAVGVVSIWTFGMMVLHYARKALIRSAFRTDSSTGKEKKMLQKNEPSELNRQKPHPRKTAYLWAFVGVQF